MPFRSFGKVTVVTAGTPVRCTINETVPAETVKLQSINVQAPVGNTGANIYLGSATMNKSTYAGVYAIIPKGASAYSLIQQAYNAINLANLYLDADTSGDTALVSGLEV